MMKQTRNGKAQFVSALAEITALLKEGQTGSYIYKKLTEDKQISISYPQFQRYLSAQTSPDKEVKTSNKVSGISPTSKKQETSVDTKVDSFRRKNRVLHNPSMTPERKKEIFG